jgi:hypothetical protein
VSLWLTPEELQTLTGRKRPKDQVQALADMVGVRFRVRADGFPLVERWQFEGPLTKAPKRREPDFDAVRRTA